MIWFTLRQFRTEGIVALGLLAVFAVVLLVTGVHLVHVSDAFEATCKAAGNCSRGTNPVVNVDKPLQGALPFVVVVAPALAGLFLGAPLIARELESGTFRLAWTQSVTRTRWLAVKIGLVGLAAVAFGGLLTWMVDWWASPLQAVQQNRFGLALFSFQGVAPLGYAAFAFALGVTAGVLLRRTVAAMAVTGAVFGAARLAVTYWARPHLAAPVRKVLPLTAGSGPGYGFGNAHSSSVLLSPPQVAVPNGWVYSTAVMDRAGRAPTSHAVLQACPYLGQTMRQLSGPRSGPVAIRPVKAQFHECTVTLSATYHTVLTYQPPSRFWPFQWAEMGIFLAGALALCALTYWWLHRRYA